MGYLAVILNEENIMNDVKRYQNPLDELAGCDNGDYVLYSDYESLMDNIFELKDRIESLETYRHFY